MSGDSETINVELHHVNMAVLDLNPNQTLVLKQKSGGAVLSTAQRNAIVDQVKAVLGRADAKVMFLPPDLDLGVIETE